MNNGILSTQTFSSATDLVGIKPLLGVPQTIPIPYHLPKSNDYMIGNSDGSSSEDYIFIIDTSKLSSRTVSMNMTASPGMSINLDWGDGTNGFLLSSSASWVRPGSYETRIEANGTTGAIASHTYARHGIYRIIIKGIFSSTAIGMPVLSVLNRDALISIESFPKNRVNTINVGACNNLTYLPPYLPTGVTTISFANCSGLNVKDILIWDVSRVTSMAGAFQNSKINVNGDWNWRGNNPNTILMFCSGIGGLKDINFSGWTFTDSNNMFRGVEVNNCSFINWSGVNAISTFTLGNLNNCILSGWRVSAASYFTFNSCSGGNIYLPSWDFAGCTDTNSMFINSNISKSGLDNWNVSGVTNMSYMFVSGSDFMSSDLSNWNISKVNNFNSFMLGGTGTPSGNIRIDNWNIAGSANCSLMFADTFQNKFISLSGWKFLGNNNCSGMFSSIYITNPIFNPVSDYLNTWDTSGIVNMNSMFRFQKSFNRSLGNWNVSGVTNMANMFQGTTAFSGIGLSNWRPTNCINFSGMFLSGVNPLAIGISGWTIASGADLTNMFRSCTGISSGNFQNWTFNRSGINCTFMFSGCTNFRGVGLDSWYTSGISNMSGMFQNNTNFNINLSNWDVGNVTNMPNAFRSANAFVGSGLSNWRPSKCTNFSSTFFSTPSLTAAAGISGWNIASGANLNSMFGNSNLTSGNFSNWIFNGDNINCASMLQNNSNFQGNGLESWNTSGISNMTSMFTNDTSFNANLSGWKVNNVTTMISMFDGCFVFAGSGLSNWNVSKCTNFTNMFNNTALLAVISGWTIPSGADATLMFNSTSLNSLPNWIFSGNNINCTNMFIASTLSGSGLDSWNTSGISNTTSMFNGCSNFNVNLSGWNVSKVSNMNNMFAFCTNFKGSGLENWNLAGITVTGGNLLTFAQGCTFPTGQYDLILNGWNANKSSGVNGVANWRTDLNPNFGSSKYTSAGSGARAALVAYGWTITDGGFQP